MSLRFILGRANSGKSTLIYDEITRLVQSEPDGPPLWLLVPEQATFQAEQALAERLGGIMRVRVVSFQRLAYNVLNSVSGAALVPVGELGRSMLVRKVIEEKKKELKIFARSASQPGFAEKIVSLVSELKRYRVKPDDLASALKNHAQLMQPTLRNKLTDLHTVYACLQDQYDGVSLDSDDSLEWLAEHVRDFDLIRSTTVWLDGFTGFTPQEYAVISALLGMSSVVVALTLDAAFTAAWLEMSHPFYTPWVTYSKLRQASKHLSVACEQQVLEYQEMSNKPRSKPLAYLEQTYLDRQFPPYEGEIGGDICLVRAATRRVEVEAAAREIIRLCRDLGFKMRDICIVVRDISLYEPLLSTVLPVHDIPFFLDKKREVQHHPLLELVRSILEAVLSDFPYEATMRALKTDLFPISRDEVDLLDNFSLSTGLRGSRWIDERPLTLANPETEAKLNVSRDKIAPYLRYIKIAVEKGDTVLDFAQGLYGFLDSLQAGTVLQAWANQAESRTDMDTALLHAQVYQSLLDLLDEMVRTLGTESIPFASFVKVLDAGLSSISLGLIPPSLDQVIIAELGRSRVPRSRAVLVLGVNEGVMPSKSKGEGLLSDDERQSLSNLGLELGPSTRRQLFDEEYLIYIGLTRSTERLWMSFGAADAEGKALLPSIVVKRIKDIFPALNTNVVDTEPPQDPKAAMDYIAHSYSSAGFLSARLKAATHSTEISLLWWDVYSELLQHPSAQPLIHSITRGLFHRNQVRFLSLSTVERMYGTTLRASVSRLERLRACPFSYYAAYGLKLRERPVYKLAAVDLGNFFHLALDKFADSLQVRQLDWADITREQYRDITGEVVRALAPMLQNDILSSSAKYRFLTKRLERVVERSARVLGVHARRGQFRPIGLEVSFGQDGTLPGLRIDLPDGGVMHLEGRIDRIDTALHEGKVYLRIIDYKSGHSRLTPFEAYYGLKIQLLTYLEAALANAPQLIGQEAIPAGALYFRIQDPMVKSKAPLGIDEAEGKGLKEFKASGFVVADADIVNLMDAGVQGYSQLIPVRVKTDGTCTGNGAWEKENIEAMLAHLRQLYVQCGQQILQGDISIAPFRTDKDNACRFCKFMPVCQFDTLLEDNQYNELTMLPAEKVWDLVGARRGERE